MADAQRQYNNVIRRVGGLEGGSPGDESIRPCYPPSRRFRSDCRMLQSMTTSYPPSRRFRRPIPERLASSHCYPPCRRFRSATA